MSILFTKRRRKKHVVILLLAVIITMIVFLFNRNKLKRCNETLEDLCLLYQRKKVIGPLCPHICADLSMLNVKCLNIMNDGKTVLLVSNKTQRFVLKSSSRLFSEILRQDEQDWLADISTNTNKMVLNSLFQNVHSGTQNKNIHNLLLQIVQKTYNSFDQIPKQVAAANALSLLKQEEYIVLVMLNSSQTVPQLVGHCGHFYAVEFTPPDKSLLTNNLLASLPWAEVTPWKHRARVAVQLLELVFILDTHFDEPINLCDVKGDNFGSSVNGIIKLIDVDSVLLESELRLELNSQQCSSDRDCDFWDCHGQCDVSKQKCTGEHSNSNMQAICSKILTRSSGNGFRGLLDSPPAVISGELSKLLNECVGGDRESLQYNVGRRIVSLLQTTI